MEKLMTVLNAVPTPALLWQDGRVAVCNDACKSIPLQQGQALPLPDELRNCTAGQTELELGGKRWDATAQRAEDCLLVTLVPEEAEDLSLLAAAARSLRDPMTSLLMGCSDLFPDLEEMERIDLQEKTSMISRSFFRLLRVNTMLRDTCQLALGQGLFVQRTDIKEFFAEQAMIWTDAMRDAGVELRYTGPKKAFKGNIDRHLLSCAVLHLLSNAAQYHREGTPIALDITYLCGRMKIAVKNQGEPMSPEVFSTVFSRYMQMTDTGDSRWGAGLGLHLVQKVARCHGGAVVIRSEEDGTEAAMVLDLDTPETDVKAPRLDLAGGYDPALVILSDILPNETYDTRNVDI